MKNLLDRFIYWKALVTCTDEQYWITRKCLFEYALNSGADEEVLDQYTCF